MAGLIRFCAPWRGRRGARGAELVEFAFALPLLLFVVFGIIDFGFLFHDYEIVTNAAREGARLTSLGNTQTADVQSRVADYIDSGGLDRTLATTAVNPVSIPINGAGTTFASGNQVVVQYPHQFRFLGAIAGFFNASFGVITLTASSTMRSEIQ